MDFIFCTYKILKAIQYCGMTKIIDITSSDHCGLYLDIQLDTIINSQDSSSPSPFERKLNSKSPQAIKKYQNYLKKKLQE